jgi:phosphatidylserine decarboxylase
MKDQHTPIAKEGYPFILFFGFLTLIFAIIDLPLIAFTCLILTGFTTWFFRDPVRVTPDNPGGIICPADGKVIIIKEIDDNRFLHGKILKISIFMNVFNVHVNRIPHQGTVEKINLKAGKFYAADHDKAALHNEYCAMIIRTKAGIRYGVVQVAGLIARRIVCWAEVGDSLSSGERYGLIRFGSRVDLYLPPDTEINVQLRQKVKAGETILGHFKPINTEKTD